MKILRGYTLIELIVTIIIASVVGAITTGVVANQSINLVEKSSAIKAYTKPEVFDSLVSKSLAMSLPSEVRISDNAFELVFANSVGSINVSCVEKVIDYEWRCLLRGIFICWVWGLVEVVTYEQQPICTANSFPINDIVTNSDVNQPSSKLVFAAEPNVKREFTISSNQLILDDAITLDAGTQLFRILGQPVSFIYQDNNLYYATNYNVLTEQPTSISAIEQIPGAIYGKVLDNVSDVNFDYDSVNKLFTISFFVYEEKLNISIPYLLRARVGNAI